MGLCTSTKTICHAVHGAHILVTPHVDVRAGCYVIVVGVHLYVCLYVYVTPKKLEWHFSGRLTFSNSRGSLLVEFID